MKMTKKMWQEHVSKGFAIAMESGITNRDAIYSLFFRVIDDVPVRLLGALVTDVIAKMKKEGTKKKKDPRVMFMVVPRSSIITVVVEDKDLTKIMGKILKKYPQHSHMILMHDGDQKMNDQDYVIVPTRNDSRNHYPDDLANMLNEECERRWVEKWNDEKERKGCGQ